MLVFESQLVNTGVYIQKTALLPLCKHCFDLSTSFFTSALKTSSARLTEVQWVKAGVVGSEWCRI